MKIVAAADLHGRINRLQQIKERIDEHGADVLVLAGDLVGLFGTSAFLGELARLELPVLIVTGNSDRFKAKREMLKQKNITDLHLNETRFNGVAFMGIDGTVLLPFASKIRLREKSFLKGVKPQITSEQVLVTHTPPRGFQDRVAGKFHAGSGQLRMLVEETKPKVLICGHIHEDYGVSNLGDTKVVNCSVGMKGKGALIEIRESGKPEITLF